MYSVFEHSFRQRPVQNDTEKRWVCARHALLSIETTTNLNACDRGCQFLALSPIIAPIKFSILPLVTSSDVQKSICNEIRKDASRVSLCLFSYSRNKCEMLSLDTRRHDAVGDWRVDEARHDERKHRSSIRTNGQSCFVLLSASKWFVVVLIQRTCNAIGRNWYSVWCHCRCAKREGPNSHVART